MLNLLFSPSGRINSSQFMMGAYILIAIGIVIALLPLVSYQMAMIFGLLGYIMIWCWIVLWIKRFHDGNKSGWMCLLPIIVYIVLSMIAGMFVSSMVMSNMDPEAVVAMTEGAESGDIVAMFKSIMGASEVIVKKSAIPNAISTALLSLIVAFFFNMLIKHDPNDNQYGPAS